MAKPKTERLLYVGPVSSFSIVTPAKGDEEIKSADRALVTGVTYDDLPGNHPVIQNLRAAKLLIPPPKEEQPEASPDVAVSDSTNDKAGDDSSSSVSEEGKAK